MWFISTDGNTFPASTIGVTEMTKLLSNSPGLTTYSLPVKTFGYTTLVDQPGAPGWWKPTIPLQPRSTSSTA